jgi:quinol monooxygenase YgiN
MSDVVSWLIKTQVKPGQLDAFRTLMEEMVKSSRSEPGTLAYEWFINDANDSVHIYERYENSAAVLIHGATFGEKYAERFMGCVEPTGFDIYGAPSADVQAAFSDFSPGYFGIFGGFAR